MEIFEERERERERERTIAVAIFVSIEVGAEGSSGCDSGVEAERLVVAGALKGVEQQMRASMGSN